MKKTDQDFAKDYIDFLTNGQAVAERGLNSIAGIAMLLEQAGATGKNYSGPIKGILPKMGEPGKIIEGILDPDAVDLRETLEAEVQKTLRATLGAQFTAVEGTQVISRAYNPQLNEAKNARRIKALLDQMRGQYEAKLSMSRWYASHNHSMDGYGGPIFSPSQAVQDNLRLLDEYDKEKSATPPPGTVELTPGQEAAGKPAAPAKIVQPVRIDEAPSKKKRSFWDRVKPFAAGGAVDTGAPDPSTAETVTVTLPEGGVVHFPAGTTKEQMNAWYEDKKRKEARQEQLLNLAGSATAGGAGAAAGWGAMRGSEAAAERMPFSPLRISPGERRFADAANRDQVDLSDAGARLRELQGKFGIPAIGIDALPTESRGLVNEAMRSGTPATADLQAAVTSRNNDARATRLPAAIDKATQADPYMDQSMKLQSARSQAADPLYAAMRKNQWVPADKVDVQWMMNTVPGREAFDRANTKWNVDKANKGKVPYRANRNALTGKEGLPKSYSIDYLDQVKQALDDLEADATGKGYSARDVADMRRRYLEELDAERPDYAKARMAYREGSKPLTAMAIGRGGSEVKDMVYQDVDGKMVRAKGFMEMSPDEVRRYLAGIGGGIEMENLRTGVAEALNRELRGTSAKANPATAMLENPDKMQRMELLLDPKDYNRFKATLENEAKIWDTSTEFGRKAESARGRGRGAPAGGSLPAERVAGDVLSAPVSAAKAVLSPFRWLMGASSTPKDPNAANRAFNPREAEDIVKIGATRRAEDLEKLGRAAGRRATRGKRAGRAGIVTGLGAAGAALYNNFKDDEEPLPEEQK